jgi:hypothetical protein
MRHDAPKITTKERALFARIEAEREASETPVPHAQRSDDHDCDYRRGSCICRECDIRAIEECAGVSAAEKATVLASVSAKPATAPVNQQLTTAITPPPSRRRKAGKAAVMC